MKKSFALLAALVSAAAIVAVLGAGCPPIDQNASMAIVKSLCSCGCNGCKPAEGEAETFTLMLGLGAVSPEFVHGSITPSLEPSELCPPVAGQPWCGLYPAGTEVLLTPVPHEGYLFDHWTGDLSGNSVPGVVTINANMHVTAEFTAIAEGEGEGEEETFRLMLGLGAVSPEYVHGSITPSLEPSELCPPVAGQPWCGLYPAGTEVLLTPVPHEGYVFDHWTGDLDGVTVPGSVVINADMHVTAEFTAIAEGETAEGEIVEGEGEVFTLMLGLGAVSPEFVHGSITPSLEPSELCPPVAGQPWCGLYPAGTEVLLTPVPHEGYVFDHWTGDLDGITVPGSVVINADMHVTAEFTAIAEGETAEGEIVEGEGEVFTLMLGLGAVSPELVHGSITPNPPPAELCPSVPGQPWCGLYPAGTEVLLTPVPHEGYVFDHWTGDLDGVTVPGSVVINANMHVTAEFIAIAEGEGEG